MATFTLSEAISHIKGYGDKVAGIAQEYMSDYIEQHADKGYAEGNLKDSIKVTKIDDSTWAVGTDYYYGVYVDKGRGPVHAKNPSGRLHYYDPVVGAWMHPKKVGPMKGIHFIDETRKHLESLNIGL